MINLKQFKESIEDYSMVHFVLESDEDYYYANLQYDEWLDLSSGRLNFNDDKGRVEFYTCKGRKVFIPYGSVAFVEAK